MTVEIKGQALEVHFGMKGTTAFYNAIGTLEESPTTTVDVAAELLWAGLVNGAYLQKKTLTVTFADVVEYVEEALFDKKKEGVLEQVSKAFAESKYVKMAQEKLATEEAAPEEEKKSLISTLTTSKPSASAPSDGQSTNITAPVLEPSY